MLTLYYVGATFMQSWRIKSVCTKIAEQLAQASITFYALPTATSDDGYDAGLATSELCTNRSAATVSEILWLYGNKRGCSLRPVQTLYLSPWISFAALANWLPFAHTQMPEQLAESLGSSGDKQLLHLLLEMEIQPCYVDGRNVDVVKVENYGKLIAWKIDSNLAVLIETNIEHFTKLLMSTFLQNNFLINDQLPLIRIESINIEGKAQPYEQLSCHLPKSTRNAEQLSDAEWQKHLDDLRALSVLANQATEFEYNKNRTEGKTGVVKPDLIPHEKKADDAVASNTKRIGTTVGSPKNNSTAAPIEITAAAVTSIKPEITMPQKKESSASEHGVQSEKIIQVETTVAAQPPSSTTPSSASSSSTVKLNKMRAKPTEIKKAGVVAVESRFRATKVSGSPEKTPSMQQTTMDAAKEKIPVPANTATTPKKHETLPEPSTLTPKASSATTKTTEIKKTATSDTIDNAVNNTTANKAAAGVQTKPKRPSLRRNKNSLSDSTPLNVLIYSESISTRESALSTLKQLLAPDTYTLYPLTLQQVEQKYWSKNTVLLVVCGAVPKHVGELLVDYFLQGGKMLSICSDLLHFILPTYRTAEVREHELVQFSYDKWQRVKMMHHVFCYQPSPVKKNFSTDSEDSQSQSAAQAKRSALVCPRSIELKDLHGEQHNLDVKVLGTEETWNTPSLLLANSAKSGGKAVFSQIHLETNPSQFETDESKYNVLKANERIRLEILGDILCKHLNVHVQTAAAATATKYTNAYFLGLHEPKLKMLEQLQAQAGAGNSIGNSKLTLHFCGKNDAPPVAQHNLLPILIHSCPDDFSTLIYFDNLKTTYIGRLVIYCPVVSSSMHLVSDLELADGIVVLPRQQTEGIGRSSNQWLSPLGCAMFTLQLHISLTSTLGARLPLLQLLIGVAIVNALKNHELYAHLNIGLKWPNDIYADGMTKIGGLIIKTAIAGTDTIVNIGCGINLDNSKPTLCINDMIREYNRAHKQNIPLLQYEQYLALIFNEIEKLIAQVQAGDFTQFYKMYYALWLHSEQTVVICDASGQQRDAQVIGVDDYGYLQVKLPTGAIESVQPDGNSFDMLKGLIVPKFH